MSTTLANSLHLVPERSWKGTGPWGTPNDAQYLGPLGLTSPTSLADFSVGEVLRLWGCGGIGNSLIRESGSVPDSDFGTAEHMQVPFETALISVLDQLDDAQLVSIEHAAAYIELFHTPTDPDKRVVDLCVAIDDVVRRDLPLLVAKARARHRAGRGLG